MVMSPQRILGVAALVIGIILLIVGLHASDSVADRASDFWTGRFTEATTWYIIGGIGVGVLGLLMVAFGGRTNRA
jgi:hypothetical protein